MPPLEDEYLQDQRQARLVLRRRVARNTLEATYREFARLFRRVQNEATTQALTEQQAAQLSVRVANHLDEWRAQYQDILRTGINSEIEAAVQGHRQGLQRLRQATGANVDAQFPGIQERAFQAMTVRRGLGRGTYRFKSINDEVLGRVGSQIDDFLRFRAGSGVTSRQATKELAQIWATGTEDALLKDAVDDITPGTLESVDPELEKWHPRLKEARELTWKSKRIVRSELGNAYNEADRIAATDSPVVRALKWTLSALHPFTDVCDLYAEEDPHGLGPGVYHAETYPMLPHPNCLCWPTHQLRPVSQWDSPKPPPTAPSSIQVEGVATKFPDKSQQFIQRQVDTANDNLETAWQVHQQTAQRAA